MMEEKTFREWLQVFGYEWVEGREQLYKSRYTEAEAQDLMNGHYALGDLTNGR